MGYVLSVLALFATFMATFGNTWSKGRLTSIGWAVIVVALAICGLNIKNQFDTNREKQRIKDLGCQQVLWGIHTLISPFAILIADATRETNGDIALENKIKEYLKIGPDELSLHGALIFQILPMLKKHEDFLKQRTLNDHPSVFKKKSDTQWSYIFTTTAIKGIEELQNTLSAFGWAMDSQIVEAVRQLHDEWLTRRIENLSNLDDSMSVDEFLGFPGDSGSGYFDKFLYSAERAAQICSKRLLK